MNSKEKTESARKHFVWGLVEFYLGLGLSKDRLLERIEEDKKLAELQNDFSQPYNEVLTKLGYETDNLQHPS